MIQDDGPALHVTCVIPTRVWAKVLRTAVDAPLGFAPRFTDSEPVVLRSCVHVALQGRYCVRRRVAWPDYPKAIGPRFMAVLYPDGISLGHGEAQSPRIISSAASESSQRA